MDKWYYKILLKKSHMSFPQKNTYVKSRREREESIRVLEVWSAYGAP